MMCDVENTEPAVCKVTLYLLKGPLLNSVKYISVSEESIIKGTVLTILQEKLNAVSYPCPKLDSNKQIIKRVPAIVSY